MIAVLVAHIAGFIVCYQLLSRFLKKTLGGLERIAAAIVLTVVSNAWILFLVSYLSQGLSSTSLWETAVIFVILAGLLIRGFEMPNLLDEFRSHRWLGGILIFGFLLFFHLFNTHTLLPQNGDLYSAGSTWGDLPWHLTVIQSFHQGANARFGLGSGRDLEYPIFPGAKLTYPFLIDFHTAGLVEGGRKDGASVRREREPP